MKPHFAFASCLCLVTSAAFSEPLQINSGEHEGFTRLVVTMPSPEREWSISGDNKTWALAIDGDDIQYETDGVFSKIARDRLTSLQDKDGLLQLGLACNCSVKAYTFASQYIVIDIADPVSQPANAATTIHHFPHIFAGHSSNLNESKTDLSDLRNGTPSVLPETSGALDLGAILVTQSQVGSAQQALLKEISRATSQGVLKPVGAQEANLKTPRLTEHGARLPETEPQNPPPQPEEQINLNVKSSVMDNKTLAIVEQSLSYATQRCVDDSVLNVTEWGNNQTFAQQIALLRSRLVSDIDIVDETTSNLLAKAYVHFGFGAEALQVLKLTDRTPETHIVESLAHIIGNSSPRRANPFLGQSSCSGNVALWAVLSGDNSVQDLNENAVLRSFSALPFHLRAMLAPELSGQLIELGHNDSAALALQMVDRSGKTSSPSLEMAGADVAQAQGFSQKNTKILEKLAFEDSDFTPVAIAKLVEQYWEEQLPPPADIISLLDAFVLEHRESSFGPKLRRAKLYSSMLQSDFANAFDVVEEIDTKDGSDASKLARSILVQAVSEHADDFDTISLFSSENLATVDISPNAALAMAERLFQAGFLTQAAAALSSIPPDNTPEGFHRIKGMVAMGQGFPRRAEAEFLRVSNSTHLTAQTRAMAGDHLRARDKYDELSMIEKSDEQSWFASDWKRLSGSENENYKAVATVLSSSQHAQIPVGPVAITDNILSQTRDLLEQSEDLRRASDILLGMHQPPTH
nr:hypothetical protein [uncultured Shimia sp.]